MEENIPLQTIELLKAAKPLFENSDSYLTAAIGALGAIGGVFAAYFPNRWLASHQRDNQRKSTAFQIYAELKTILEIESHRSYIKNLRELIQQFDSGEVSSATVQVEFPDERYEIYKTNMAYLGLLPPRLQSKIVLAYQLIEAVVQDLKPGGVLNVGNAGREHFCGAFELLSKAKSTIEEVLAEIEFLYPDIV